jgi:hypothetical protein
MLRPQPPFKYDPDAVVGGVLGILTPATYLPFFGFTQRQAIPVDGIPHDGMVTDFTHTALTSMLFKLQITSCLDPPDLVRNSIYVLRKLE